MERVYLKPYVLTRRWFVKFNFRRFWTAILPVSVILLALLVVQMPSAPSADRYNPIILFAILTSTTVLLGRLALRLTLRNGKNASLYERRRASFDEEAFYSETSNGTKMQVPLRNFAFVREFDGHLLLFLTGNTYFPVSIDAFNSPEDRAYFISLLRKHKVVVKGRVSIGGFFEASPR